MKKWVVRIASLLVFNVVVLLLVGWLTPARVGWSALWAGIVMTALVLWVKPVVSGWLAGRAAKSAHERTKLGERLVQLLIVLALAFGVWIATVLLSGVKVGGWFWGYVLPPVIIAIGWMIYAAIDDRVEQVAGEIYDKASAKLGGAGSTAAAPAAPAAPADEGVRRELQDGLTAEQRKMLDDLG